MTFSKLFGLFLLVGLACRFLPGMEVLVLATIAGFTIAVTSIHRRTIEGSNAHLRTYYDQTPGSEVSRRLMVEAGYNV